MRVLLYEVSFHSKENKRSSPQTKILSLNSSTTFVIFYHWKLLLNLSFLQELHTTTSDPHQTSAQCVLGYKLRHIRPGGSMMHEDSSLRVGELLASFRLP